MNIKNKVAIITGSSSGIGRATAFLLAQEGVKIVINSNSNIVGGKEVAEQINRSNGEAIYIQGDMSNEDDVLNLYRKTVEKFGTVDILINNAGKTIAQPFIEASRDNWERAFNDNLLSAVFCSREAAKIMLPKKHGTIINTTSVRGLEHTGREGIMAYSAAKAAVINFTKTLAKQLAPYITVNAIAPGFVFTQNYEKNSIEQNEAFTNATLIKRFIKAEEIAEAYLFLVKTEVITGEVLVVDGGFSLKIA
jgi:3-oxoacyl-[acyl-carrier protein] reductase